VLVRFIMKRRPKLGGDQRLSLCEEAAISHFLGVIITRLSLLSRFSPGKGPLNARAAAGAGIT
jgi:hypothetical protein